MHAKPGDKVNVHLAKKSVSGVLLESYDAEVYLVKLSSGYNVGIPKEQVQGVEVVKQGEKGKQTYVFPKLKEGLKTIGMIVTGGTIASKLDPTTGGVTALTDVGEFAHFYPELFKKVNVKTIANPFMELSENMHSDHWVKIGEEAEKLLNDADIEGIVITHGTDFLHYTASALSFMLGKLHKPVVLTYSQRSIDRGSSDARLNVLCAAEMATSQCAEVMVVGHANSNDEYCFALRGTTCKKLHSSRRDAFKPVNAAPIAKVWPNKVEFLSEYAVRTDGKVDVDGSFSDKVALLTFYPGQKPDILDWYAEKGYKGVIIAASGLGHVAVGDVAHSWLPTIKRLVREGFFICAAAQTVYGRLHPQVYSVGRALEKAGVLYLEGMLAETALVKLQWVLGHRQWRSIEKVREKMLYNFAGELPTMLHE